MTTTTAEPREAPSPQKDRAGPTGLLLALAIGPGAWIVQLAGDYALASHACRPNDAPRLAPPAAGWGGEHLVLLGLNLACLGLCLVAGGGALVSWRRTHGEKPGETAAVIEVGEGRTRFLAACGTVSALAFALAIAFDTALPFLVPSCWRYPS
jgi:hypothetical protein